MARFVFALEPLLKARRRVEQTQQGVVAEIERDRLRLEADLRSQQQLIASGKDDHRTRLTGAIEMRDLRLRAHSSRHAIRRAQQLVLELAGVHRRLEAARAELAEASRQRRAIELLKERRFDQWTQRLDRAENTALDELATAAAARQEPE